ncbi:uncharacterized protein LOC106635781 [Copidosoma floridanum]|uniref:uncharacterized protein LOC106635781 n=1 Tax=Copidosoma floridanum TaxID=29053 RepID=UPI0006C9A735|nr:uncharacterized protein LOC106635781 [Copidosoma floridanum]
MGLGVTGLWLLAGLLAGAAVARHTDPKGATYDQRQEGKVNVQIDVKDVHILALVDSDMLEDYTNYDYAYDYADFTIKPRPTPSRPTTASASTTESEDESLQMTTVASTQVTDRNLTSLGEIGNGTTTESATSTAAPLEIGTVALTNKHRAEDAATSDRVEGNKKPISVSQPRHRCPYGFVLKSGKCFKRRMALPRLALMKLAPALLKKTQIGSAS